MSHSVMLDTMHVDSKRRRRCNAFHVIIICLVSMIMMVKGSATNGRNRNSEEHYRRVRIVNNSKSRVEVSWLNLETEARVLQQDELLPGGQTVVHSSVLHEFELKELPSKRTGKCGGKKGFCRTRYFQITEKEDQYVTLGADFRVTQSDSQSRAKAESRAMVQQCRENYAHAGDNNVTQKIHDLSNCMKDKMIHSIMNIKEEIGYQSRTREKMGYSLGKYACNDPSYPTAKPLYDYNYNHRWVPPPPPQIIATSNSSPTTCENTDNDDDDNTCSSMSIDSQEQYYKTDEFFTSYSSHGLTQILFKTTRSKIILIDNFISPQQCSAILEESSSSQQSSIASRIVPWEQIYNENNSNNNTKTMSLWLTQHVVSKLYGAIRYTLQWDNLTRSQQQEYYQQVAKEQQPQPSSNNNTIYSLPLFEIQTHDASTASRMKLRSNRKEEYLYTATTTDAAEENETTINTNDSSTNTNNNNTLVRLAAKFIMFCDVPPQGDGGAIHFPKNGIHIQPQQGQALLITYDTTMPTLVNNKQDKDRIQEKKENDKTKGNKQQHQGQIRYYTEEYINCPIHSGNRTMIQHLIFTQSSAT